MHDDLTIMIGNLKILALPLWLFGIFIIIHCCIVVIRRGLGTPAHLDPPKKLIVEGLYRHIRNPIYLGALLVVAGHFIWFGSLKALMYDLLFFMAFQFLILFIEEPILKNTFGVQYQEYMNRVPRWLPKWNLLM